jgi:alpha-glucoside transport system permease protein
MDIANSERNRKQSRFCDWIGYYLWLMPAIILVLFFLVLPTFQTIYLSLHQQATFSESELRQNFMHNLKAESRKEVGRNELIQQIPRWRSAVDKTLIKYKIHIAPGDINSEMTVKDTTELLTIAINELQQREGENQRFAGLKNYAEMLKDNTMLTAFKNNLIWLVVFTILTVILGLLIAALADRVKWSTLAKTVIFLPMAISGAAAAVIWNFMYFKDINTGTINALIHGCIDLLQKMNFPVFSFEGIAFLGRPGLVNIAVILAAVWMQVGFCTVIFSAALKAVPVELLEMARIEGAKSFQIFFKIEIPVIRSTIILVVTQMIMWVLKVFDIIYALTQGGPFGSSEVIANRIYMTAFNLNNFQYASAMAVVLFIAVIPVLFINIRNLAYEESVRE